MQKTKFLFLQFTLLISVTQVLKAQATFPVNDVANPKDGCYAFTKATIVKNAHDTLLNATMVIRQGKIEGVGNNITIPKRCRGY